MKKYLWSWMGIAAWLVVAGGCALRPTATAVPAPAQPVPVPMLGMAQDREKSAYPQSGGDTATTVHFGMPTPDRMVVRTAHLDLVVPDTEKALDDIQTLAQELGGYVVSVEAYQYQEGRQATITFRVPTEQLDAALDRLRAMATTVRRESVSGQDVTDQYVDLRSRLRHLEAKEKQLLEFLDRAEDTEAVLEVYEHLSATQAEIEQVKGRMQYLENQAALATITVSLTPDVMAQPLETGGWNLPATVRNAVETLLAVLEFFVKALIYIVIVVLPALILAALPVVGIVLLVRWLVRRRRHP
ncbi:MAG: DUF4349 domain-containing protein [Anaerolineae bacterium]|nr:DUF4349 domain-containing protein [Anaerolineae bacterium]MDW8067916.1 DUF4349 domain-containing protein [Anaerolineae bacterium]